MILGAIKTYLMEHRRVAVSDLAHRFDIEPDALRPMLAQWERKGRLRRVTGGGHCGGCTGCAAQPLDVYEWVDGAATCSPWKSQP